MKYLKRFEDNTNDIELGDYVAIKKDAPCSPYYKYFLYNPCKVVGLDNLNNPPVAIKLVCKYDVVVWRLKNVEFHSKNKEDVEAFMQSKKYNL